MSKIIIFLKEDKGATAVEYSLMAFAIAAVIAGVVFILGGNVSQLFQDYNSSYEQASK